ncbi:cAMP receptor protein [Candidatus Izimaplasma bacterium HR1]|jgi:CRP-like cAMP-binding protein|uniref:Crp/Fnr family transcriptional regulator n=1 Tax=Candidatus Izimoplasma sp. HR1 TaxID=1541959 RepID=UPI0004F6FAE3|nr:cAMP receptor protein [Candidatus Izimaplasma bacterium HR1]
MRLEAVRLFENTNIDTNNIEIKEFPTNYTVEIENDSSTYLGIILEGRVNIRAYSYSGKEFIISSLEPGMIYGDVLLFGSKSNLYPGNVITKGKTVIAFLKNEDVRTYLQNNPKFAENYLSLLSDKVYNINHKYKLLTQDSIRDKILFFVHQEMRQQNSPKIRLNMTKEELANNLFVQRPSLSRELIKMRKEGIIDYDRWTITLKKRI